MICCYLVSNLFVNGFSNCNSVEKRTPPYRIRQDGKQLYFDINMKIECHILSPKDRKFSFKLI